ncbi:MAG: membrane fusion protein (multidrug efflux system) [Gammaproteobacteria bacterium]|jgi:membrane fusion protein (multidrug efflux system)
MKRAILTLSFIGLVCINLAVFGQGTMPVSVAKVMRAVIAEEINLTGSLRAVRVSQLSSEVEGLIERLNVDSGDQITRDQVVVELNSELANIAKSLASAEVDEATARENEARRRLAELTELAKQQHVPKTNVETARSEIHITGAALAQARASLRRAQALLDRHIVRAPFEGVVSLKLAEVGQWVDTSDPLIELVETKLLRLVTPVPQYYFSQIRKGTRVSIRFDSLPNEVFDTEITAKIPVSDSAARTFPVQIDLANDLGRLAPGMSARVMMRIEDASKSAALLVPQDAVVRRPNGKQSVWTVVVEDGVTKATSVAVSTGRVYRNSVEIVGDDLQAGMRVIVRGNEILRPGQVVTVADELATDI